MKDKGHFWLSIIKSLIRIGFCLWAWKAHTFELALYGLMFAECLGILEEVVDMR